MGRAAASSVARVTPRGTREGYWRCPLVNITDDVSWRRRIRREMVGRPMRLVVAMSVRDGGRAGGKFAGSTRWIGNIREGRSVSGWIVERIFSIRADGRADL